MSEASNEHIELYKRFRPTSFSTLRGQERVARALRRDVLSDKVYSAYLFSGPRGTGKTSAALLFAKALNCENRKESGDPCNACPTCKNIDANRQLGVSYVSMANKGSVDDVRELVRDARLSQPVKRQVFILDEIHNVSRAAYDALLIPLEDTSLEATFIFCTTEIQRVPETIKSRSQKRRFNLVNAEVMMKHLKGIVKYANLDVTEDMLESAVRSGRGSVRDTLSELDTIMATGEEGASLGTQLLEAMGSHDLGNIYRVVALADADGASMKGFSEQTFEDLRHLLLMDAGVGSELAPPPPVSDPQALVKQLGGSEGLQYGINELGNAITKMPSGADHRILLELALFRINHHLKKALGS